MLSSRYKHEWFGNVRGDLLAGMVVAMALIPEAIAFSIIAGVDPRLGLYASFIIAVITAFIGGRPGMISAATAAMALVLIDLVRDYGVEYVFPATILAGVLQLLFAWARLARYLRFIPRSVMTGFVNALAILIFLAQLPQFEGANWQMYALVAAGLAIIYFLPRLTKVVPSALVAIVLLTVVGIFLGFDVRTVGDMGDLPTTFPIPFLPPVPFSLETLLIILPVSFTLAIVGLLESLLTAQIIDDLTESTSDKNQESQAQGVANIATGFFGGMAGCAMIGQSVINVTSGGRGRLSSFTAGVVLLLLIVVLQPLVIQIPMAALVAVMFVVAFSTFDWGSVRSLAVYPKSDSIVMLATVITTVITHDLMIGVLVGVVLSAIFFARKVSQLFAVRSELEADGRGRRYRILGQLFFVSSHDFANAFDYDEDIDRVVIDLSRAHLWDTSAVGAIDKVALKFMRQGVKVELIGMNEASETLISRLAEYDKPGALDRGPGH